MVCCYAIPVAALFTAFSLLVAFLDERFPAQPGDPNAPVAQPNQDASLLPALVCLLVGVTAILLTTALNCCMLCIARLRPQPSSVWYGQWAGDTAVFPHSTVVEEVFYVRGGGGRREQIVDCLWVVFSSIVVLAMTAAPISLLVAAITTQDGGWAPWYSLAAIPTHLALMCSPCWFLRDKCFSSTRSSQVLACAILTVCGTSPLAVVAGLAAARADGLTDMPAWAIFLPLLVLDALVLLVGIVGCCATVYTEWERTAPLLRRLEPMVPFLVAGAVFCGTVVTLQILLVLRFDGIYQATWGQIAVPVYLVVVPVIVAFSVAAACHCGQREVFMRHNTAEIVT